MMTEYDIPFPVIKAVGNELIRQGLARKIRFYMPGKDVMTFVWDTICIESEPRMSETYIANRLHHIFDKEVVAVSDKKQAYSLLQAPQLSCPSDEDLKRMAEGHPFIPAMFRWDDRGVISEIECSGGPRCLVVRKKGMFAGMLWLKDGKLSFEYFEDSDFVELSFKSLLNRENLLIWLKGFLPGNDVYRKVCERKEAEFNPPTSEIALFEFFESCGSSLANDMKFINPPYLSDFDLSRHVNRIGNSAITRAMPDFAASLAFPFVIFPEQEHGFACDFDMGIWNAGNNLGYYFIPLESYGMEKMTKRIALILLAEKYGIPVADMRWIKWGALKGLALRRFDLFCGKQMWRQEFGQLNMSLSETMKLLDDQDRLDLFKRFLLLRKCGLEQKFTLLMPRPDVYPMNGPDGIELELIIEEKKYTVRLAPFIGEMKGQSGKFSEQELIEKGYEYGFPIKKIRELDAFVNPCADMEKALEQAREMINKSEELHV